MFERQIPSASLHASAEASAMRSVAWPDLVAKFAAARDLRALFAADFNQSLASFAPGAASALSGRGEAELHVNPDALVHGKGQRTNTVAGAEHARDGDREKQ